MKGLGIKNRLRIIRDYEWMIRYWLIDRLKGYHSYYWVKCPVCGHLTQTENHICPFCSWEYDDTLNENEESYVNGSTIKNYRMRVIDKYGEKIIKKKLGNK